MSETTKAAILCRTHGGREVRGGLGYCTIWASDTDVPITPICRFDVADERLVVLSCPWEHHHLWPADLEPYPSECMAKVASLPSGEWPTCGKNLHVSRYVTGEQNGRSTDV